MKGIFAVPKDYDHDRLIINPQNINSRMLSVSDFTKSLAPGSMLSLLSLEGSECFRFSADDLTDFYYTFKVTQKRAERNSFRFKFAPHELEHLACFKPEHRECGDLLICLSSLAMGDSLAVEVAQQAHHNVLSQLGGSMVESEVVRYRHPIPRGDFVELLAIDDHVGIQRVSFDELETKPPKRDTLVFANAERAYRQVLFMTALSFSEGPAIGPLRTSAMGWLSTMVSMWMAVACASEISQQCRLSKSWQLWLCVG